MDRRDLQFGKPSPSFLASGMVVSVIKWLGDPDLPRGGCLIKLYLLKTVYSKAYRMIKVELFFTPFALSNPETRSGHNAAAFQFSQTIPLTPYSYVTGAGGAINETLVELSGTSAAIFLTVYPTSLSGIADSDLQALANQILSYQSSPLNRDVYLRYGPEMQGNWMPYGGQPSAYVTQWKRMHDVIRATAPKTVLVWAPNGAMVRDVLLCRPDSLN